MSLLPRKGLLAITAVVDVALHARERPVSARKLAARHNLPARHLEPVLQALVHEGIFNGIRGPRGGYALAREERRISVSDILRAAASVDDSDQEAMPTSRLLDKVVMPAIQEAEQAFASALSRLSVEDLMQRADAGIERLQR
jgi:Rrf2 family transcriptional regulator, iron-sulfur cluster assembly transcription factor